MNSTRYGIKHVASLQPGSEIHEGDVQGNAVNRFKYRFGKFRRNGIISRGKNCRDSRDLDYCDG
ncbi:MAG: hypothetical protein ACTSUE_04490 [Promethearchaeota archaeon]